MVGVCPLTWVSVSHTEVALSTPHAEYVDILHSLRYLLPIKNLLKNIFGTFDFDYEKVDFTSQSMVYEYNQGTMIMSKIPLMTSRYQYIAVKYHWFRYHIGK